ncbi:MAG: hypothetical protein ACI97A_004180 [Planctomycetota bacterium]|jgi:hypothetical protein
MTVPFEVANDPLAALEVMATACNIGPDSTTLGVGGTGSCKPLLRADEWDRIQQLGRSQ